MTDPIDEYAVQNLAEFDGKKLQSITKENVKFGDEAKTDKKRDELYAEQYKPLVCAARPTCSAPPRLTCVVYRRGRRVAGALA